MQQFPDEAALVVVGHCLILQKSMDSTSAETPGELLFTFSSIPQYHGIVTQLKSDRWSQWDIIPVKRSNTLWISIDALPNIYF